EPVVCGSRRDAEVARFVANLVEGEEAAVAEERRVLDPFRGDGACKLIELSAEAYAQGRQPDAVVGTCGPERASEYAECHGESLLSFPSRGKGARDDAIVLRGGAGFLQVRAIARENRKHRDDRVAQPRFLYG